jgi:hypothetical protein
MTRCAGATFPGYKANISHKILYLGIAANFHDNRKAQLALVFHDATYLVESLEMEVELDGDNDRHRQGSVDKVANSVIDALETY